MHKKVIGAFHVAGLSARTSNDIESTPGAHIPKLWQQFMQSNLAAQLTNKIGQEIYVVYTDYESDYTGAYTYIIGYRVQSPENLPHQLTSAEVPAGEYAVLTSEVGLAPQIVPALWAKVWPMTPAELGGTRAYQSDFELYDHRAVNPQQTQIDLFLGLHEPAA